MTSKSILALLLLTSPLSLAMGRGEEKPLPHPFRDNVEEASRQRHCIIQPGE